ncbi:hypothetical protein EYZ11_011193 [Aspergillus tanneri]|uniref:MADS-box domain-containing protein n=1 Tax=Aspergillus tanneri TaxID=1220188 RepID=A0A4V3UN10_9EURO|nr:uncharacterized protein ATNIH1004_007376 [Aspergillus tanneri]KAA8645955.1 hypothetical protein ATNIH1004_007376 [Aspergillus tanneri]THC89354.1 hypothetical protein EYZ11_011193 [Aspergillus tanneri]
MGRRKIEIKAIKDDRNRSVTFLKRKGGLFKKAHELAVLCSVDVAVIIFGHNKKLYEFSSCDMRETLHRYQYLGPPHEHKGPEDFNGRRDDDDDDDEDGMTPAPEDMHPTPPQNAPAMIPAHIQGHPGFQHVNHAPSASPPIANGIPFNPRHGTPQPQGVSRPSSRNHLRRVSSSMGNQSHHATPPPPPPSQNGFAYMPNPSVYNPNLSQQSQRSGQFAHYGHPPGPQHPHPPPPQHQQMPPHSLPPHSMPPQSIASHHHTPPPHIQHQHPHLMAPQAPPMGLSQAPHAPVSHVAQAYLPEQGRNSMPPTFASEPQQPPPRTVSLPEAPLADQIPGPVKAEGTPSPPHQRSLSSKSRSIFTPIDDRGSVLARHFGVGPPTSPNSQLKAEGSQGELTETKPVSHPVVPPPPPAATETPSATKLKPPIRTNSGQLPKRPQLKVQIPSENSDHGSATAESSSRDSAGNKTLTPAKANADAGHPGVVLPPPSPSASAILSAGAQGPPNPFARPPPPGATAQNNNAYSSNNSIETPMSALPSRFVSDALLPSPSSFFPEWGFGRSGPDSNMLPSPLTFPTPAVQTGPGFARDDEQDKKRKSPDSGTNTDGTMKKAKT